MEEIKCAIYTRKSTDEGLEKEFNTLEAQREAGENYVKSQKHQGWILVDEHYDDGGFSGGNMKRPALQRLFKDIELGKINMIVVYKIDRLTRSLVDFSKMVDIFDKYHCSFVSVTQNFNTSDSMGRLTLNTLNHYGHIETAVVAIPMLEPENLTFFIVKTLGAMPDNLIINGTGAFKTHSSVADCGVTGRKLACDFYGTAAPIGGGSPWTKDSSKADVTLNIYARRLALQYLEDSFLC